MGQSGSVHHTVGVHWDDKTTGFCLLGGLLVGAIAASRMLIFGKVTGVSGFIQHALVFEMKYVKEHGWLDQRRISSFVFLLGMMIAGAIETQYIPDCLQDWSDMPMERLVIAGLLVGFGTKMGNGCTSGHGVCGLSSFRYRSLVAVCTFMVAAFITAIATDSYSYLPTFRNEIDTTNGYAMFLVALSICALLPVLAWYLQTHHNDFITRPSTPYFLYVWFQEFLFGVCFGIALGVSNMTLLSAAIAFLDLRHWNPALAFVMGGGVFVATPAFYFTFKGKMPLLDIKFHLSKLTDADKSLVIGSAIFGIGWGLFGATPCLAFINLGSGYTPPITYAFAIIVGMYIEYGFLLMFPPRVTIHTNEYTVKPLEDIENLSAKSQG